MSQKPQVMVVDDDLAMCGFLRTFLGARGYDALTMTNADEAVRRFHAERPAAVLLDVVMPGSMDGLAALAAFKKIDKDVPIIVISGQGRTSVVVQAMKLGATDFVCKPFEDDELEVVLDKALKQRQLSQEVASLRAQLKEQSRYTMLFGHSQRMTEVRDLIERVSDTDVTVLIRGESGTGKELVARALHEQSLRKDKPFVKVNCAALPTELLESELFGFEKGAFTGAIQHKPGKFEFANHGTMFLDEIGDMSFPLQAKLLQVLQDGEFSRLGGKADVHVDVRVIAATNCDLEIGGCRRQVPRGSLLPPERRHDHDPAAARAPRRDSVLTDHFLKKYSVQYNKPFPAHQPGPLAPVHGIRLAGQRPPAREHDQADGRARQRGADRPRAQAAAVAVRTSGRNPPPPSLRVRHIHRCSRSCLHRLRRRRADGGRGRAGGRRSAAIAPRAARRLARARRATCR